jgi:Uma2 family endonuclease
LSTASFEHILPWTEEEYLELGATPGRVELFDGSLLVSPAPTFRHQRISHRLHVALAPAAAWPACRSSRPSTYGSSADGSRSRIWCSPRGVELDELVADAETVELICEITSPSNAGTDRVLKMHHYAEAGIPWYLLVEPDPIRLQLFRLEGGRYAEHASAEPGRAIVITEPVAVTLHPADLVAA